MEETNHNQRDDRFSRGYKLEGTSISAVTNKVEDCDDGYFFDGRSNRCVGNFYLFLHQITFPVLLLKVDNILIIYLMQMSMNVPME